MRRTVLTALVLAWGARAFAAPASPPAGPTIEMGEVHVVAPGENLEDLARANDLGFVEIMAANPGVDPWAPRPGTRLALPTTHIPPAGLGPGITVNLGDMRLYWKPPGGKPLQSFPIGIGREGFGVPLATTHVAAKRVHPTWYPPASIRAEKPWLPAAVPPGPDNPMGDYALDLALGLIRIHGTNLPDGVGRRVSHGCLRLYPEDIARLFPQVRVGAPVRILDQPARVAWMEGELWLEANPDKAQDDAVENRTPMPVRPVPGLHALVAAAAGDQVGRVDWAEVAWVEARRPAIPVRITRPRITRPRVTPPVEQGAIPESAGGDGGHTGGPSAVYRTSAHPQTRKADRRATSP